MTEVLPYKDDDLVARDIVDRALKRAVRGRVTEKQKDEVVPALITARYLAALNRRPNSL